MSEFDTKKSFSWMFDSEGEAVVVKPGDKVKLESKPLLSDNEMYELLEKIEVVMDEYLRKKGLIIAGSRVNAEINGIGSYSQIHFDFNLWKTPKKKEED